VSLARSSATLTSVAPHLRKAALLLALIRRELDARYRGALLGRAWPLVAQAAQLLVFTYLFSAIFKVRLHLDGIGENAATYGLWLFAGFIPWTAFSTSVAQGATSVIIQQNLIKKVVFPLALLPLVPIFAAFVESLAGFAALIVLFGIVAHTVQPTIALLPIVWIPQLLLTAGLAYFFSALTVFIRDIPQALAPALLVWFYVTPVVYPSTIVPPQMAGLTRANPMTFIVSSTRDVVIYGHGINWVAWLLYTVIAAAVFAVGFGLYRKLRPAFADVL
jgi:lipopolysaccharide transport system permease protein